MQHKKCNTERNNDKETKDQESEYGTGCKGRGMVRVRHWASVLAAMCMPSPLQLPQEQKASPFLHQFTHSAEFFDGVSFERGSQIAQTSSVVKTDLEPLIFLPLPPSAGNTGTYHHAYAALGIEPRASCMLAKHYQLSHIPSQYSFIL